MLSRSTPLKRSAWRRGTSRRPLSSSRQRSVPVLKKKLWVVFSRFIRQRDKGICFTCGKRDDWRNTDAGHYIPKSVGGINLYFDEQNVHCQCTGCNRFRHGNLHEYALRLQEKYGANILQRLQYRRQNTKPWTVGEYEFLIGYYENKLLAPS